MGNDGYWSWIWSIIFFLLAMMLIATNHLVRFLIEEKKKTGITIRNSLNIGLIGGSITLLTAIAFVVVGAVLMANGVPSNSITFSNYNNGIIILVIGASFILLALVFIPYIIRGMRIKKNEKV